MNIEVKKTVAVTGGRMGRMSDERARGRKGEESKKTKACHVKCDQGAYFTVGKSEEETGRLGETCQRFQDLAESGKIRLRFEWFVW